MDKFWTIAGLSFAALAFTGVAQAQQGVVSVPNVKPESEIPWHERFTTSTGVVEQYVGPSVSAAGPSISWMPTARWGVTVKTNEGQRTTSEVADQASIGAFYHFSPRFRVGGQLSVTGEQPIGPRETAENPGSTRDTSAGVKLESAFKF